jgi:hypothetical protein
MSAMQSDNAMDDDLCWGSDEPGQSLPPGEYADEVRQLLAESAPRRFAIVQEWGDRYDARIAAWGLASADDAHIFAADGSRTLISGIPLALRAYTRKPYVTARVHWLDPE